MAGGNGGPAREWGRRAAVGAPNERAGAPAGSAPTVRADRPTGERGRLARTVGALAFALVALAACTGAATPGAPTAAVGPAATAPALGVIPPAVATAQAGQPEAVQRAVAALAARLSVPATGITLGAVESWQWNNTSFGCPKPGQTYRDSATPGYRIVLTAGGKEYEYHTDQTGTALIDCAP